VESIPNELHDVRPTIQKLIEPYYQDKVDCRTKVTKAQLAFILYWFNKKMAFNKSVEINSTMLMQDGIAAGMWTHTRLQLDSKQAPMQYLSEKLKSLMRQRFRTLAKEGLDNVS